MMGSKKLIEKHLEGTDLFFMVCPLGIEALSKMKSGYKQQLSDWAEKVFPVIFNLSDKKIEEEIARKTDILSRKTGGQQNEG